MIYNVIFSTVISLSLISSLNAQCTNKNILDMYFDSVVVVCPDNIEAWPYFYTSNRNELDSARIIQSWRDSVLISELAYSGPYTCIGGSFASDSLYFQFTMNHSPFQLNNFFCRISRFNSPISISLNNFGRLEKIALGDIRDSLVEYFYNGNGYHGRVPYINGKRHGNVQYYYKNGQLAVNENWHEGLLVGIRNEYFDSGFICIQTHYLNGLKDGAEIQYNENGMVSIYRTFSAGKLIEEKKFE